MVQIFKPGKNAKSGKTGKKNKSVNRSEHQGSQAISSAARTNLIETVTIDALDHQGKGVVRGEKVTFVSGAITGEECKIHNIRQHKGIRDAQVLEIVESSPHRQQPFCSHFSECGGCQTQHIQHSWFTEQKQQALNTSLRKSLGDRVCEEGLPWQKPLLFAPKGYRRKARLAVDARNPDEIKLGFRNNHNQVFSLCECQILEPELQALIAPLQELVKVLKAKKALGHISLFNGHVFNEVHETESSVVTFRFTKNLPDSDLERLRDFATANRILVQIQLNDNSLQNIGSAPVKSTQECQPGYVLQNKLGQDIRIAINSNDFVQINADINQAMVQRSADWLKLGPEDRVLDLFCGVGNFSLALASQCKEVVGFEGVPEMVQSARRNAQINGINNVRFFSGDLNDEQFLSLLREQNCNKVVLDPARAGALKVMDSLRRLAPELIVYVSCNPSTFGRDIAKLLEKSGESNYKNHYQLVKLSIVDMFPNTSHSEIMGLFELYG